MNDINTTLDSDIIRVSDFLLTEVRREQEWFSGRRSLACLGRRVGADGLDGAGWHDMMGTQRSLDAPWRRLRCLIHGASRLSGRTTGGRAACSYFGKAQGIVGGAGRKLGDEGLLRMAYERSGRLGGCDGDAQAAVMARVVGLMMRTWLLRLAALRGWLAGSCSRSWPARPLERDACPRSPAAEKRPPHAAMATPAQGARYRRPSPARPCTHHRLQQQRCSHQPARHSLRALRRPGRGLCYHPRRCRAHPQELPGDDLVRAHCPPAAA